MSELTSFVLMSHNCSCAPCAAAVASMPDESPLVTGHRSKGGWSCVYCGGPVSRGANWASVVYVSVRSWVGQLWWHFRVGRYFL